MKKYTFPMGGIHLDKHKLTSGMPIIPAGLPEFVYIPVRQHIGAPAKVLVQKGDKVKVGTLFPPTFILLFPVRLLKLTR